MDNDTIFAIASGAGRAAIAVFRLSGPAVRTIVEGLAGKLPEPHAAVLAIFGDPATHLSTYAAKIVSCHATASFGFF